MASITTGDISLVALVTMLAAYQLGQFAEKVGKYRRKHKINPPAVEGPPEFLRVFRAQQNSLEFMPLFMAALWVAGLFFHQIPAAMAGLYYIYARYSYFDGYTLEAKKREAPFHQSVHALKALLGMAMAGVTHAVMLHFFQINLKAKVFGLIGI